MLVLLRIALRNTRRQVRRSVLLGGALAFGMMVITLVNAFTAGVIQNIRQNFAYLFGGHVFVSGSELTPSGRLVGRIGQTDLLQRVLKEDDPRLASVHRRSRTFATLIFGAKEATQRIDGVDFQREANLARGLRVLDGSLNGLSGRPAIVLPRATAEKLGVKAGERVLVRLTTVTGQQNVGELDVAAIIDDTGAFFGLTTAYVDLSQLNVLLGLRPDQYQVVSLYLRDMREMDAYARELAQALIDQGATVEKAVRELAAGTPPAGAAAAGSGGGDEERLRRENEARMARLFGQAMGGDDLTPWRGTKFDVTTLNQILRPAVSVMAVLDAISLGIFVILLLITMVGILNTFRMILIERTREIGTMRAFGMQRYMVRRIFLMEAAVLSLAGGVAGTVLAALVMAVLSRFSFAHVEALQFFLQNGHFTWVVTPGDLLLHLGLLLGTSLLAAFLPANAAARLEPVRALRAHF